MSRFGGLMFLFSGALALIVSPTCLAMDAETVVALGYDQGGDRLLRVVFTDGSERTVRANQGVNLRLGAMFYHTEDLTWQTQATVGMQYNQIKATNGAAEWRAYPVEGIFFYNANLIRLGLGATYQLNPHLRTTGVVSPYGAELNNALGWIVQAGFRPKKKQGLSVDMRYTFIRYSGSATYAGTPQHLSGVDGSSVGVYLTAIF